MSLAGNEQDLAKEAKEASLVLGALPVADRDAALQAIYNALGEHEEAILAANRQDMEAAEALVARGLLQKPMVKRLNLALPGKFEAMRQGVLDVKNLPDPLGRVTYASKMDEGLHVTRVSCSLGVLLVIFEARPEVVVNITALALKSGNAAILKGGKESIHTSSLLVKIISETLSKTPIPPQSIVYLTSREQVAALLGFTNYIDLVIPRGSNALVSSIQASTRIPVMGHADGRCCIYVHQDADLDMARDVILDAKINYPAACNAVETLLVHPSLLRDGQISRIVSGLLENKVQLRCESDVLRALPPNDLVVPAAPDDITTEFLDLKLYIRCADSLDAAIHHINTFSSHHTDAIITSSPSIADEFQRRVDSAGVYWNASTRYPPRRRPKLNARFADGFRYGFGAEVGVSTGKLHARGPVGLEGLTSYKYLIQGSGQGAGMYSATGGKKFLHERSV